MKHVHAHTDGGNELVLLAPHISEKASNLSAAHVYTFLIDIKAGKRDVIRAMKSLYGVTPTGVRIVRGTRAKLMNRGRIGRRAAEKKAYVTVPEGTTIDLG